MTKDNTSFQKTCSICGEAKPLSAFIQIGESKTNLYGNICATCRATRAKLKNKETDDGTTSTTGLKIDAKAKIHLDIEKNTAEKAIEDEFYEERSEDEIKDLRKQEKTEKKAEAEQKHRNEFLKNPSFLQDKKTAPPVSITNEEAMSQGKTDRVEFNTPFVDTQIVGKTKYQSVAFKQFQTWLGGRGPLGKTIGTRVEKNLSDKPEPNNLTKVVKERLGPKRGR